MITDFQTVRAMIERIAEFFRFMSDNEEQRLYYVLPVNRESPYAYQHSSIRDVATVCNILDLILFFKERKLPLTAETLSLFERVTKNTLHAYCNLYQGDELPKLPEGNIGDLGFMILALQKSLAVYPSQLSDSWKEIKNRLIKILLERQNADGSLRIFFDDSLSPYEKSSEAFYLPEALIGLIEVIGTNTKELDDRVTAHVQKAMTYCCQEKNRKLHLAMETGIFYANWQFQLTYCWAKKKLGSEKVTPLVINHLEELIIALKKSNFAKEPFGYAVAAVEVACYLEGLTHAKYTLEELGNSKIMDEKWLENEIARSLLYLDELQMRNLEAIHGGFVHSFGSHEARIDVAGHVFSALCLL